VYIEPFNSDSGIASQNCKLRDERERVSGCNIMCTTEQSLLLTLSPSAYDVSGEGPSKRVARELLDWPCLTRLNKTTMRRSLIVLLLLSLQRKEKE